MSSRKTRSGRVTKKPDRWEPDEEVVDDFKPDEYDTDDGSDVSSKISLSDDEEPNSDDEGFIAQDSDEDDEMYEDSDEEEDDNMDDYDDSDYSE